LINGLGKGSEWINGLGKMIQMDKHIKYGGAGLGNKEKSELINGSNTGAPVPTTANSQYPESDARSGARDLN
jgi:hypothetical protein